MENMPFGDIFDALAVRMSTSKGQLETLDRLDPISESEKKGIVKYNNEIVSIKTMLTPFSHERSLRLKKTTPKHHLQPRPSYRSSRVN
jgi:hypothetical protein